MENKIYTNRTKVYFSNKPSDYCISLLDNLSLLISKQRNEDMSSLLKIVHFIHAHVNNVLVYMFKVQTSRRELVQLLHSVV